VVASAKVPTCPVLLALLSCFIRRMLYIGKGLLWASLKACSQLCQREALRASLRASSQPCLCRDGVQKMSASSNDSRSGIGAAGESGGECAACRGRAGKSMDEFATGRGIPEGRVRESSLGSGPSPESV